MDSLQNKTPTQSRGNEIVAEREPVIRVAVIALPVQVRFTFRTVPPDVARLIVAVEGCVQNTVRSTTP